MIGSSRFPLRAMSLAIAATSAGLSFTATASMGNIGTTYGVLPSDIASAQALSMFNTQVSATYYNPAYLAADPRGELTTGILHAEPELRAKGTDREGDVLSDRPSQHVLIGMKTNLSSLTRVKHPIYLGFVVGVEKFGKEMLAFESETSNSGQFLTYDRQPLFLNLGGASKVWRGIDAGFSTRITLHSECLVERHHGPGRQHRIRVTLGERQTVHSLHPQHQHQLGRYPVSGGPLFPDRF